MHQLSWNKIVIGLRGLVMEICLKVQTSLTQLQNSLFHVVGRTRTAAKCSQLQFFNAINIVFWPSCVVVP